ncbi:conserved exported hypothetical protein [Candidatus Nitrotoga sp. BS]|uniref:hypothetical protein n=1 Tax=Candidatus Nitrotoga sp. BS TaxID=2890408 RepID=UPI001EF19E66|nr:hypothetical protein [Candidatus Nitrotoga sp. BS]CAH1206959.1 conserved exported hypothetical protein [Candidatus Nitrotoga sp. BS]
MKRIQNKTRFIYRLTPLALCLLCAACSSLSHVAQRNIASGEGVLAGTFIPTTALEQIYYLGVFDPQEQLPPTIYRVRVKGQSSFFNTTRYASGWVPASVIDSLGSTARFDKNGDGVKVTKAEEGMQTKLTGRRLVLFGPEGFREAPKDHRLVITMGSSPEKFFQAVDEALGIVAAVTQGHSGPALEQDLFKELLRVKTEHERLDQLNNEASNDRLKEQ